MLKDLLGSAKARGIAGAVALVLIVVAIVASADRDARTASYSTADMDRKTVDALGGMPMPAPGVDESAGYYGREGIDDGVFDRAIMPPMAPTAGESAAEADPRIIRNGTLRLEVAKVNDAIARIAELASRRGGFVQHSSSAERGNGAYSGEITVRVPVVEFDGAMADIKSAAVVVKSESTSGQDVTEQYTDLQAQLRNAQAQEATYLEVLKRAQSVEDILKVQERLGSIRGVIESLQGRLKYLENVTDYSTISASLEEEASVRVPTKEFRPIAVAREAVQALVELFQGLVAGVIWVVIVWGGVLLPLGLVAYAAWRLWKRRANAALRRK